MQSLRGGGLQSLQPLCRSLQPVQSLRGWGRGGQLEVRGAAIADGGSVQSVQPLRGGLQPVQSVQSVQSLCGGQPVQSVQSLCGGVQPVQPV